MTGTKMCGTIFSTSLVVYLAFSGPAYLSAYPNGTVHADPKGCYTTLYAPLIWLSETSPAFRKVYEAYLNRWWPEEVIENSPSAEGHHRFGL